MKDFILFAAGIALSALGAILLRVGGIAVGKPSLSWEWVATTLTNVYVISGFALYFIPAMIWVWLMTKYPVSYVQPIIALTYIITPILAVFILHEQITGMRWAGIFIVVLGVILVART